MAFELNLDNAIAQMRSAILEAHKHHVDALLQATVNHATLDNAAVEAGGPMEELASALRLDATVPTTSIWSTWSQDREAIGTNGVVLREHSEHRMGPPVDDDSEAFVQQELSAYISQMVVPQEPTAEDVSQTVSPRLGETPAAPTADDVLDTSVPIASWEGQTLSPPMESPDESLTLERPSRRKRVRMTDLSQIIEAANCDRSFAISDRLSVSSSAGGRLYWTQSSEQGHSCAMLAEGFIGAVILLNALTIGLSLDIHPGSMGWIIVDTLFALVFFVETSTKIYIQGCRTYFFGQDLRWNIFELLLMVGAVLEVVGALALPRRSDVKESTDGLSVFRVLRLARIARVLRIARIPLFSDLSMIVNGAVGGVRTLCWSFILISVPVYVLAVILRETLGSESGSEHGAENFSSTSLAFFTVFRCIVAADCTTANGKPIFLLVSRRYGWVFAAIYMVAAMLMIFGLFNIIIAIYVENTVAAAKCNGMVMKRRRLMDQRMFTDKITELVRFACHSYYRESSDPKTDMLFTKVKSRASNLSLLQDMSMDITPALFDKLRRHQKFRDILCDLDISDEDQLDLFDTLDVDGNGSIDLEEFVGGISKLRGDARRSDIVSVSLIVKSMRDDLGHVVAAVGEIRKMIAEGTSAVLAGV